jgi:hypothetical protein
MAAAIEYKKINCGRPPQPEGWGMVRPPAENSWNLKNSAILDQILQINRLEIKFYVSSVIL